MTSSTSAPPDETEQPQVRPFAAFLQDQRKGSLHDELSEQFHQLLAAVKETGKAGTLTLQIKVKPAGKGDNERILVSDVAVLKAPQVERPESFYFIDEQGNPTRSDPRQQELPLLEVAREPGEVREVAR
jgi:hypothetical protein